MAFDCGNVRGICCADLDFLRLFAVTHLDKLDVSVKKWNLQGVKSCMKPRNNDAFEIYLPFTFYNYDLNLYVVCISIAYDADPPLLKKPLYFFLYYFKHNNNENNPNKTTTRTNPTKQQRQQQQNAARFSGQQGT